MTDSRDNGIGRNVRVGQDEGTGGGHARDGQIKDGQIKDGQIKDGQIKDGQIKDGQIKDGRIACFKAYDARGRIPDELDDDLAEVIGMAYASVFSPKRVVVGHDMRLSSPGMAQALIRGLVRAGVDVAFIGQCGTEEVYFATAHLGVDGGVMVTASHNPRDYNGMKFVREGARPISGDTGLEDIARAGARGDFRAAPRPGTVETVDPRPAYLEHLLGYVDPKDLKPLKVVANGGNGCAGPILDALEPHLPLRFTKVHTDPDGNLPNGIPNPLLPENRAATSDIVRSAGADLGIAWDGDFDRCFFFDEKGTFLEGYYVVGMLAEHLLRKHPGGKIIHDPRLTWNTIEQVEAAGGTPVLCKSGHAFIKEKMRAVDGLYGGEMSAHHYFRDFSYADSGMIPWLLVTELMSRTGKSLSQLVEERVKRFPVSGEINRTVKDADAVFAKIEATYRPAALDFDTTDGLSFEFAEWRFNLRKSNTEPLVRLNVESRGDKGLMQAKTAEILALVDG